MVDLSLSIISNYLYGQYFQKRNPLTLIKVQTKLQHLFLYRYSDQKRYLCCMKVGKSYRSHYIDHFKPASGFTMRTIVATIAINVPCCFSQVHRILLHVYSMVRLDQSPSANQYLDYLLKQISASKWIYLPYQQPRFIA